MHQVDERRRSDRIQLYIVFQAGRHIDFEFTASRFFAYHFLVVVQEG